MDEQTYTRLLLHMETLRFIVTDLETTIRLAQELEPAGVAGSVDQALLNDTLAEMLAHIGKVENKLSIARQRIERVMKLCGNELKFAKAKKTTT